MQMIKYSAQSWHLRWLIFLCCFAELFVNDNVSAAEWFCVNLQRRQATHSKQLARTSMSFSALAIMHSHTSTHCRLRAHEMIKELWIKNFCPENQLFHLFTPSLPAKALCVCFSGFTELSSSTLSKATLLLLVFLFYKQPNYQSRNSSLPILLIPDVGPVHQQAPGSCREPPHTPASIDSKNHWIWTKIAQIKGAAGNHHLERK